MTAALLLATAEMLFAAIRAQDLHQVEKMLDHDPSLASARDEKGASALGVALATRKGEGFVPRRENRIVFRYCLPSGDIAASANPNGSLDNIAGICSPGGNVVGMMPHPERAAEPELGGTDGVKIFHSMVAALVAR